MNEELTLSAMTLRTATFAQRLDAAAAAGFTGVGISLQQYRDARAAGLSDPDVVAMVRDTGLRVTEIEGPWDWTGAGSGFTDDDATMAHLAGLFGGTQITLVQLDPAPPERRIAAVAAWCARADDLASSVAVEFVPFSYVPTLADAAALLAAVDCADLGVVIDCWHWVNGHESTNGLAALRPDQVLSVQLNDPLPVPSDDLREEARHRRQLPGLRSLAMLAALEARGVRARLAVELWSDELEAMPPSLAARQAYEAARIVLDARR